MNDSSDGSSAAGRTPSDTTTAPPMRLLWRRLRRFQSFIGLAAIIVLAIAVSPWRGGSPVFLNPVNLTDIVRQVSETGIIALAMTFVILTGGIDLSVGSILALSTCVTGIVLCQWTPTGSFFWHSVLAVMAALLVSTATGLMNGVVIAALRIQPFIATLAAMIGIRGFARWLTSNRTVDFPFEDSAVSGAFATCLSQKIVVIGFFAALAGIFAIVLRKTLFGRYVRAIGDNENAATYSGLPIARIKVWVYALCGLLAGLAGVLHAAQYRQGNPNEGVGYELDAIAAVVIGGTSLSGGKGTIVGTIVGTVIMGVLTNMLRLNRVDSNVEFMIKAVIIVATVWAQSRRRTA